MVKDTIDDVVAGRTDWEPHVFEGVGHLLPVEAPGAYVATLDRWLAGAARQV